MPKRKTAPTKKPPAKKAPAKRAAPARKPPASKIKIETFRFENTDEDPIIENLRQVSAKYTQIRSVDHEILDHVSLEGLTGITLKRLCLILDAVIPNLNSCTEDAAQDHIWSVIVKRYMRQTPGARIQVFYLDQKPKCPRARYASSGDEDGPEPNKNFCIDKAIKLPNQSLKRMAKSDWMLHPVLDGEIMGSCPNYTSRRNISQEIIELYDKHGPRQSLSLVHAKFNFDYIYFVADQEMRRRALLPMSTDPNIDMKLREYACLELIGRTRCFGIVFPNDKTLGRYRILLTAKGLITQYQQTCNTFIIHHIRRFSKYNLELGFKAFKGGQDEVVKERVTPIFDEDDDDGDLEAAGQASIRATCCNPARLKCDQSILRMVYDTIALSKGRSMCDLRRKLRLPKSHVRNHLKNLANTELIGSHTRLILDKKTRIYRARHKSTRRKVSRQKKLLRGVRAKWDEADLRAKEMLGIRRSQFSQAEDSLIILCRITGLLMDPTYPKSFLVPKHVIRDILHDELFESHDKTSDSLLRRVKYLRKLPSNVALMNEITAELRDDVDVKRLVEANKDLSKTDDKLNQHFKQVLKAIRAKLPHLLGLTSSLVANSSIEIDSYEDLTQRYEMIDCRDHTVKRVYHQPSSTLVQLIKSSPQCYNLKITKCEDMQTIMLITSRCVQTSFNLTLRLKVPVRVVGLDQDNEFFKDIFEKAKESREASRMIANLTTPNPTADSRRALFMLRNAFKQQTMDKCGKLADALIIQPCDIEFSSKEEVALEGKQALKEFLDTSKFSNETRDELKKNDRESVNKRRREKDRKRRQSRNSERAKQPNKTLDHQLAPTTSRAAEEEGCSKSNKDKHAQPDNEAPIGKQEKLFKMIESVMSWVSAYPGIELESLQKNLAPLLESRPTGHLDELLKLMEALELISRDCLTTPPESARKPLLFGYREMTQDEQQPLITFAPRENAYVRLCQLIDVEL